MTKILMAALALSAAWAAQGQDIDGTWQGALDTGAGTLRVVVHLSSTKDGLTATMDSPDQGASGLPVSLVKRDGSTFTLEMKALGARFDGTISKDLSTIEGTFSQGGGSLPLGESALDGGEVFRDDAIEFGAEGLQRQSERVTVALHQRNRQAARALIGAVHGGGETIFGAAQMHNHSECPGARIERALPGSIDILALRGKRRR